MAFLETPQFPEDIAYNVVGGPVWSTDITTVNSGFELRNQNWTNAKGAWKLTYGPHDAASTAILTAFFRAVGGMANGFRFKDWADYLVASTEGRLGSGAAGNGLPTYQLYKHYAQGALFEDRKIVKPIAATHIYRNSTPAVAGGSAGQYSIDMTTGIVTFVADASSAASVVTPGATTQVTLAGNPNSLTAGKLLYLNGFAGADAALLNSVAHTINSVSGTGPFLFTLATNTLSKSITLGSGTGYAYPQASDALTWDGSFDVAVRFDIDAAQISIVGPGLYQWAGIGMTELRL